MLKSNIPLVDLRGKTLIDLLRMFPDTASALLAQTRRTYGLASHAAAAMMLPYADKKSKKWLQRTANPYLHEIETASDLLGKPGVYTFNLAYEWGCTSGAYATGEQVQLLRVLDWPFPSLGRHMVVALQSSLAGDYYNITWPSLSGIYQGMAPGRFAASINQAPMRMHKLGFIGDWFKNRLITNHAKGLPPSHLLRIVFESARNYEEAKRMLCNTPLAMPAIYTLTGTKYGEGCIIERLEDEAAIQELSAAPHVTCSNQFHSHFSEIGGWRPREVDSAGRYRQSMEINASDLNHPNFEWMRAPIINQNTRLVMKADAIAGSLQLQGYEGNNAITNVLDISPASEVRYGT